MKTKMSQLYFAKRAKQGWKGEGSAKVNESKRSIKLTESEVIDLIEKNPKNIWVRAKILLQWEKVQFSGNF